MFLSGVELTKRKCWLSPDGATLNNRRGKFIVLGSSGECLPVTRPDNHTDIQEDSLYSSCNSSDDEFHSANDSFDYGECISHCSLIFVTHLESQLPYLCFSQIITFQRLARSPHATYSRNATHAA